MSGTEHDVADLRSRDAAAGESVERRQCLLATIAGELYAFDLLSIKEILRTAKKERAPGAPDFVAGLINLRGEIVTVLDAARLLGIREGAKAGSNGTAGGGERAVEARIVVLEGSNQTIGIQVENLEEVVDYDPARVQPADPEHRGGADQYITGLIALEGGKLVILMNADALCDG